MTIAQLDRDIAEARAEFTSLNAGRMRKIRGKCGWATRYCQRSAKIERRIVELADLLARLYRFRSEVYARNYALHNPTVNDRIADG